MTSVYLLLDCVSHNPNLTDPTTAVGVYDSVEKLLGRTLI
jgi:hypothetical protein